MRALIIVLPIVLFAISAMPEPAAAQACLICVQEGICHGFVQGSDTACNEDNRDENPSCRDCSEAPDGHIGCHVETCGSEWACSQHGGRRAAL